MNAPLKTNFHTWGAVIWDDPTTKYLIDLWNSEIKSVNEIADALKTSRGSIVGKISRLRKQGIELAERKVGSRPANAAPRKSGGSHIQSSSPRRRIVVAPTPVPNSPPPNPENYVDIQGLAADHCREVMSLHPKALYCGSPKQKGSSFCPFHHAKNWVSAPPRTR